MYEWKMFYFKENKNEYNLMQLFMYVQNRKQFHHLNTWLSFIPEINFSYSQKNQDF
jgi:hypothetical protein